MPRWFLCPIEYGRDVCHIIRCQCHIGDLIRCRSHIADLLRCGTHNSDVERVKCELGFCYDCPSKKVSQKFLRISVEKMRDFFLFFTLKKLLSGTETVARRISSWHFLALAKLRSTAQVWNHQRISNSWIKVDCHLSDDSFLAHALLQGNSADLPCYEWFAAGSSACVK